MSNDDKIFVVLNSKQGRRRSKAACVFPMLYR